jgi:hypothetical protein
VPKINEYLQRKRHSFRLSEEQESLYTLFPCHKDGSPKPGTQKLESKETLTGFNCYRLDYHEDAIIKASCPKKKISEDSSQESEENFYRSNSVKSP